MVLPLIAAGIGVLSAVSSIKAQSDAARAQNASANAQIYAEQQSEEIRKATAEYQKRQARAQAAQETLQRRAAFREQDDALQLANLQVSLEKELLNVKANAQLETNRRAVRDTALSLTQDEQAAKANAGKTKSNMLAQTAQSSSSEALGSVTDVNSRANVDAELAAGRVSGGTTSTNIRKGAVNEDAVNAALQASLRSDDLKDRELEDVERYNARSALTQGLQRGAQMAATTVAAEDANSRIRKGMLTNEKLAALSTQSIDIQRQQLRTNRRVENNNARQSLRTTVAALNANSNLAGAQSASRQAQIYSQRASGVNFGTAAASVLQSALPLVSSAIPSAKVRTAATADSTGYTGSTYLGPELYGIADGVRLNYEGASTAGTFSTYSR